MEMISKKELLQITQISYGQLYRWKREGLIPDEWFIRQSVASGQETYFYKEQILPRIETILSLKDRFSHEEIKQFLNPNAKDRRFTISEAVLIKGIDPFILRIYAQEKSDLTLYDLVVVYFFSNNQTLLDINNYLSVDFKQIASLDQFFYLVKDYSGKTYLIIAGEDAVFDPQLTVLKKQALSDISGLIAQELK
ncbi:MAG TPA: DUF4004 family protein [Bacilli bacterium]|jgi:DNA-binding transcriptional MerR regulator|nr:MAG: hypothetical protein BWX94_00758 [Tenericutes bacterium ADurb.Bin140]HOE78134.1 DUF4004 family protein [Bacilli bacterium]HOR96053.1 DUF4004 family protein [Bacilli bacterium]HRS29906.1 DUF4004 family protein [Bacilli bacterium]